MFAFLPYLKTSESIGYRSVILRSSDDDAGVPPGERDRLKELRQMFFLRDHQQITHMSYAFCADDASASTVQAFLGDLKELRELLAYCYSAPHESSIEPFLTSEHSSVYVFRAQEMFRSLVENSHGTMDAQAAEYPEADDRQHIPGYECQVDGRSVTWVTRGSRIHPPCVRLWLNISQHLGHDWPEFEQSAAFGPLVQFFSRRRADTELHGRLLTALTWYNRSIAADEPDDAALVHLATAFESLLGLEQGPNVTKRFKEAVLLLIGNVPRADIWVDQFYRARSEIVHRGQTSALLFQPDASAKAAVSGPKDGYRSLTSYGWFIFQICAAAMSSGALVARRVGLESLLVTNGQRLERVCKTITASAAPAEDRLSAIAQDVADINRYRFVPEPGIAVDLLLGTVKLVTRCFLEACPSESELVEELRSAADSNTSDVLDALTRLRTLHEAMEAGRWQTPHENRLRFILFSLVDSAWHYLFMLYFHLERQANRQSTTP